MNIEQLSNPTEPRYVDKEVYVEHDMQYNSVFRYGYGSSATETPEAYLWSVLK